MLIRKKDIDLLVAEYIKSIKTLKENILSLSNGFTIIAFFTIQLSSPDLRLIIDVWSTIYHSFWNFITSAFGIHLGKSNSGELTYMLLICLVFYRVNKFGDAASLNNLTTKSQITVMVGLFILIVSLYSIYNIQTIQQIIQHYNYTPVKTALLVLLAFSLITASYICAMWFLTKTGFVVRVLKRPKLIFILPVLNIVHIVCSELYITHLSEKATRMNVKLDELISMSKIDQIGILIQSGSNSIILLLITPFFAWYLRVLFIMFNGMVSVFFVDIVLDKFDIKLIAV